MSWWDEWKKPPVIVAVLMLIVAIGAIYLGQWHQGDSDCVTWDELNERFGLDSLPLNLDPQHPSPVPPLFDSLSPTIDECILEGGYLNPAGLLKIGNMHFSKSNYNKAQHYYEVALNQAREQADSLIIAAALGNIGLIYQAKGDLEAALNSHEQALKICREIGYRQGQASVLGNIGLIYKARADLEAALKSLKEALEIHREVGYRLGEANQLRNIGLIYRDKGDFDEATKYLREAKAILDEHGLAYGRDIIERAIAEIEVKQREGK